MTRQLSATRISTFLRCGLKHYWSYEVRNEQASQEDSLAIALGSAAHAGMASMYRGESVEERALAMWNSLSDGAIGLSEYLLTHHELLVGWLDWYSKNERQNWRVEEVEVWKEVGWNRDMDQEAIQLVGIWDLLVRDTAGRQWIVDHKVSAVKAGSPAPYAYSLQAGIYLLQAELLGLKVEGVIFNLIGLAKREQKTHVETRTWAYGATLKREIEEVSRRMELPPLRNMSYDCHRDCPFRDACLWDMEG